MGTTSIEWTERSENPIRFRDKSTGKTVNFCVKHSSGCANCYAERLGKRRNSPDFIARNLDKVEPFLDENVLRSIIRRRTPTTYFLCDMTDWMAEWVPDDFIDKIVATAVVCPQHTFQLLTKRAERLPAYFNHKSNSAYRIYRQVQRWLDDGSKGTLGSRGWDLAEALCVSDTAGGPHYDTVFWGLPLDNLWIGVSCENQATFDERWEHLENTPASLRFLSLEPLLSEINIHRALCAHFNPNRPEHQYCGWCSPRGKLGWVIVGGESGHGARECSVHAVRSIFNDCRAASVPVFVKQLGANVTWNGCSGPGEHWPSGGAKPEDTGRGYWRKHLRDKKGGDMEEWPEDLRVREMPSVEVAR